METVIRKNDETASYRPHSPYEKGLICLCHHFNYSYYYDT